MPGGFNMGGCGRKPDWRTEPNGDRTCAYCGSLSQADIIDIMYRYIAGEKGYKFGTTDKGYKIYANRPNVRNAGDGGIKFYTNHIEDETEFEAAWQLVIPVYLQRTKEARRKYRETGRFEDE